MKGRTVTFILSRDASASKGERLGNIARLALSATLLTSLGLVSCHPDENEAGGTASRPAKDEILDALNPAYVKVENGQAAVVQLQGMGYLFITTEKTDVLNGRHRALYSQSGDFGEDAIIVSKGQGDMADQTISFRGHKVSFWGGTDTSVYVKLDPFDESASIGLYRGADPGKLDLSKVAFVGNRKLDCQTLRRFLEEEGVLEREGR